VLGLLPYALLLRVLCQTHGGAVLVPVFPHCSITLEHLCGRLREHERPHDAAELIAAVRTMVARNMPPRPRTPGGSCQQAAFIAHSLGSGVLAPLMRNAPELVGAAAFIDPICFLLPDGGVLRNFLYTRPPLALDHWFHCLQRYLVANEATVQDCFRNCFWWSQHWLHPSEICSDSVVHLSGRDSVAEARRVHSYLRSWQRRARDWADRAKGRRRRRVEVHLHESWSHGWLMLHPEEQRKLVAKLQAMLRQQDDWTCEAQTSPATVLTAPPYEAPPVQQTPLVADLFGMARQVRFHLQDAEGDTASNGSSESVDDLVHVS